MFSSHILECFQTVISNMLIRYVNMITTYQFSELGLLNKQTIYVADVTTPNALVFELKLTTADVMDHK